ncbi:MAG TPA: aminopeptidase [Clostridia bacterium]|nr:aminopeptidase [Clostridia bacterium]
MKDPRLTTLAKNLLHYSLELKAGDNLLIELHDEGEELVAELIKETYAIGAKPYITIKSRALHRELMLGTDPPHMALTGKYESLRMKDMNAYLAVKGFNNALEYSDIPGEKMGIYRANFLKPVHIDIRVPRTRWCLVNYPTEAMAQSASMSLEQFEDFYFNVCNLDYSKMSVAMNPLAERMKRTDRVRITGPGTELTFSIKGLLPVKCDGKLNIPDGEVFTAPVMDSVNGYISYNTPSEYEGRLFENVRLEFRDGRIVKAAANDTGAINQIFDTDAGARYVGEFAIGVNPYIVKPMKDILFDEKIMGSFHFTPGNSYDNCSNGNKSAIHWDLVCIQTPEYGGGEIWFDDVLIRKDGRFVPEDLNILNPENLI